MIRRDQNALAERLAPRHIRAGRKAIGMRSRTDLRREHFRRRRHDFAEHRTVPKTP